MQNHPRTEQILKKFPKAVVITIDHYKDVFCRSRQNYALQHRTQKLILAEKTGNLIYGGAPVCQNFGNEHFYYASCVMNCIFDCEYCYLKGMYPSGNIVVFVNLEDVFEQVKRLLEKHPVYLCVSYDTDLLVLEPVLGYVKAWEQFAAGQGGLKIEIRTKSANKSFFSHVPVSNVIYAFTISPQAVIFSYERRTPSLAQRLDCVAEAVRREFPVRLCFDPMLYCRGWEEQYDQMLTDVHGKVDVEKLFDVSIGSFRVSQDYLKKMRKNDPNSLAVWFPYQNIGGVYQYPKELREKMEGHLYRRLKEYFPEEKIFLWGEKDG